MKGKQNAAASSRRAWHEIERERDAAVLRAERAEKALAEESERTRLQLEKAKELQVALRGIASTAVAPVVDDLRKRVNRLRAERDEAVESLETWVDLRQRFNKTLARTVARHFSVPYPDALGMTYEAWMTTAGDAKERELVAKVHNLKNPKRRDPLTGAVHAGRLSGEQAEAVAVARGQVTADKLGRFGTGPGHVWTSDEDALPDVGSETPP